MNRYKRYIPIVALVLVGLGVNLDKFGIDLDALSRGGSITQQGQSGSNFSSGKSDSEQATRSRSSGDKWSSTNPEINLWHIFDGEINRSGEPTGYHSRPGGKDTPNTRIVSIKNKPNRAGVYTANIEVLDGNKWKGKFSSFFPDSTSKEEVIDAILNAYSNGKKEGSKWSGPSGHGFTIQGYTTRKGGINTAFPVFRNNQ